MSQSASLRQPQTSVQSINLDRKDLWEQALKEPHDTLKTLSEIICDMDRAKDRASESHLVDELWISYHQHEEAFHARMAACLYRLGEYLLTTANKPTQSHWDLFENLFMNHAGRSSFAHALNLSESAKLIVSAGVKWIQHQADFESPSGSAIEALGRCINKVEALKTELQQLVEGSVDEAQRQFWETGVAAMLEVVRFFGTVQTLAQSRGNHQSAGQSHAEAHQTMVQTISQRVSNVLRSYFRWTYTVYCWPRRVPRRQDGQAGIGFNAEEALEHGPLIVVALRQLARETIQRGNATSSRLLKSAVQPSLNARLHLPSSHQPPSQASGLGERQFINSGLRGAVRAAYVKQQAQRPPKGYRFVNDLQHSESLARQPQAGRRGPTRGRKRG